MCLAIPGQILEVTDPANRLGTVEVAGVRRTVNLGLVADDAGPGDWVLIHVGFALSRDRRGRGARHAAPAREMGAEYEQELEELKASAIE